MKNKPIILVAGEPYSIFFEIFFKSLKKTNSPILLVGSKKLLIKQMKALKFKFKINELLVSKIKSSNLRNGCINIVNVNFNHSKIFDKITIKSNKYIEECCNIALKLIKITKAKALINGPISKSNFLKKKYPGMTEYFENKVGFKNKAVMLIYNKRLSVSPLTTHIPIKKVTKKLTKKKIISNIKTIYKFYKENLRINPKFVVTCLNPHCETSEKFSEDKKIVLPAIKFLKKNRINVSGPFAADTIFLKDNLKKYNVVIGMYHDQVLTPLKTIYQFDAINITLGLPFFRITPDHGPNNIMLGKNISNPESLIKAIEFAKKIK